MRLVAHECTQIGTNGFMLREVAKKRSFQQYLRIFVLIRVYSWATHPIVSVTLVFDQWLHSFDARLLRARGLRSHWEEARV